MNSPHQTKTTDQKNCIAMAQDITKSQKEDFINFLKVEEKKDTFPEETK